MPKKVDAEARRREVVEALFRVAVREGLARASLRTVADEAQLNIGSLRHYFDSQLELMRFAMRAMLDRVAARVQARLDRLDPAEQRDERVRDAVALLAELLPLDETRRDEVTVFVDFAALSRTNPDLRDLAAEAAAGTRGAARAVLAHVTGTAPSTTEVERLTSLVDGLGLNAVLHPDLVSSADAERVLTAHLTSR
ncbi:TetR/AcrR family transcriptional regulator [Labedaea rhizosphaerae]|uniref:TetR family transcriptional regulator n=1 Tax=Labedaea rhizosphaerae TaxID=598644 RepID=A0A4R6SCN8_LABRH|nr:TetR family transcriptional regulator C-terminal domain-containing protein [Labedaea rhizosphaerae]TDP96735.1 TetR family transcriptional regulator [Labedaea rhizosphaerae]